ncbi:MAG: hypothetical protein MUQ30_11125 [Anaerolineae bacterium]|nr:hypothetical protein [Anaerolineae bacterium]
MSTAIEAPVPPVAAEPARIAPRGSTELGSPTGPPTLFETGSTQPSAPIERAAAPAQPAPPEQVEAPDPSTPAQSSPQLAAAIRSRAPDVAARALAAVPAASPQIAPPLQDVWAVQRLPEPVRTAPTPVATRAADSDRHPSQTTPEPVPDEISELLDRVAAGRPTQSTIEIILPRRPRPQPVRIQEPEATAVAETVASAPAAVLMQETTQPTIPSAGATIAPQTLPPQKLESPEAMVVPLEDVSGVNVPRPVPTVVAPRTVETEIGALPADLWELIGETPPAPQGVPRSGPAEPHAPTTEPAPVPAARMQPPGPGPTLQRSAISTTAQAPASATATQQGDPVQTGTQQAPSSDSAASEPAPSETGTVAASESEATGELEVDVDSLAHRVYADIRRRLTVEWERTRRY